MLKRAETDEPINPEDQDPFFGPLPNLQKLAERQSVKPVASLEDLAGDFWPESESDEEVVTAIRKWRRQGG
jgi:hypothetical protein